MLNMFGKRFGEGYGSKMKIGESARFGEEY
jgi:hypothetical protein